MNLSKELQFSIVLQRYYFVKTDLGNHFSYFFRTYMDPGSGGDGILIIFLLVHLRDIYCKRLKEITPKSKANTSELGSLQ